MIKELEQMYAHQKANGFDVARAYLGLGDKDQALAWLEKDVQTHNATMPGFMSMPPFLSMRDDPRFKDLTKRIGLAELKSSKGE